MANAALTLTFVESNHEKVSRHITQYYVEPVPVLKKPVYLFVKRGFDIIASLAAGTALMAFMLLIGLLIKLDSPGPAIFKQERLGENGKKFTMYKFRSMHLGAEKNGPRWAEMDDERATRVGRILRRTRLDELPQLWNILMGDMSFVGPRPEREFFYHEFEAYIHGFSRRMAVQPGLTGWAQINGGYELRPEEKIVYDMEYIKNRSVKMDLYCLLKSVKLAFTHEGAR